MKIGELLQKKQWTRKIRSDEYAGIEMDLMHRKRGIPLKNGVIDITLTQEDFDCETNPFTHNINSALAKSNRKVYKQVKDKNGKSTRKFSHYAEVFRVALGLQEFIISTKVSHASGAGIWMSNETPEFRPSFEILQSMYDIVGMDYAWVNIMKSLLNTCDAAIYQYRDGDEVKWEVFSHLKGDTLYPSVDINGNPVFAREFSYRGKRAVQVFTLDSIETWTQDDKDEAREDTWMNRWLKAFIKGEMPKKKSEDGWTRLTYTPNQLPNRLPVTYFRIEELPSACVQSAIASIEDVLSDFGEEAKMYAYQSLFLKGRVKSTPSPTSRGKIYIASGDNDDAKTLDPSNSSDIVKILLDKLEKEVFRTSKTVYLTPEMIKGSDVATASLRLLFAPQVQWCQLLYADIYKGMREMMNTFKLLTGQAKGKPSDFSKLIISVGMDAWIPENEKELVEVTTAKVYAGLMSKVAGRTEIGNKYSDEEERIKNEAKEKMELVAVGRENRLGSRANVQEEKDPNEPKVDNKDIMRTT